MKMKVELKVGPKHCEVLVGSLTGQSDKDNQLRTPADRDAVLAHKFLCGKGYEVVPPKGEPIERDKGRDDCFRFCIHLAEGQDCSQVKDDLEFGFPDNIDIQMRDG